MVAIKNFQRMIQSIMKFCFGSIARGSLNFWIGSTTNEPEESDRRCCRSQRILDVFVAFMPTGENSSHKMTAIRRITEVKRDNLPFRIRLAQGREFSVDSGGSVEIGISAHGDDCITVFDVSENIEYRIPVAAIARISTAEDLDDQRTWTKNG